MAYIKKEKLMELSQNITTFDYETKSFGCFSGVSDEDIEKIPIADVAEVKHGEWENFEIPHMMRCSECGVSDLDIHHSKFIFCPYCGAKMDGTPKERGGER